MCQTAYDRLVSTKENVKDHLPVVRIAKQFETVLTPALIGMADIL